MIVQSPRWNFLQLLVVTGIVLISGCMSLRGSYYLRDAEEALRQNKYDEAIGLYRKHIDHRLKIADRPQWENPNFYLMTISDIELRRNRIDATLAVLEEAQKLGVDGILIGDRYLAAARWYEKNDQFDKAAGLLRAHREIDPLLFDAVLDRLLKAMTAKEDAIRLGTPTPSSSGEQKPSAAN